MTAGPYSLSALYDECKFELLAGTVIVGACNSDGKHNFCAACFSWIYSEPDSLSGMVNIRTPMLEDAASFPPFAAFFCDESLPRMSSGAPHQFGTAPEAKAFMNLAEEYAVWSEVPG